jgi:CBS-domain-containing membrane protein
MPAQDRTTLRLRDRARPISVVPTSRPDEDLAALIQRVGGALDQRVLVFEGGRLVGIVSPVDVARVLAVRQTLNSGSPAVGAPRGHS